MRTILKYAAICICLFGAASFMAMYDPTLGRYGPIHIPWDMSQSIGRTTATVLVWAMFWYQIISIAALLAAPLVMYFKKNNNETN